MSSLEVQTRSPSLALLVSVHLVLLAHDGDTVFSTGQGQFPCLAV